MFTDERNKLFLDILFSVDIFKICVFLALGHAEILQEANKNRDIICFPSTGGASHGVGSTPTEVAPSPNHANSF